MLHCTSDSYHVLIISSICRYCNFNRTAERLWCQRLCTEDYDWTWYAEALTSLSRILSSEPVLIIQRSIYASDCVQLKFGIGWIQYYPLIFSYTMYVLRVCHHARCRQFMPRTVDPKRAKRARARVIHSLTKPQNRGALRREIFEVYILL